MIKFITSNRKKVEEMAKILAPQQIEQVNIDLDEIQGLDPHEIIAHKLKQARQHLQGEFIVEDSSMSMEALGGKLPGPLVKWFNDTIGSEGYHQLAQKLGNDAASAITIIGLSKENGEIIYFEGKLSGKIVKPTGDYKFGYDEVFMPDGENQTLSQMKAVGNFNSSPRGIAVRKLKEYLEKKQS